MKKKQQISGHLEESSGEIDSQIRGTELIVAIDSVKPNPWNYNKQNDFIFEREKTSIQKNGFIISVLVREIDGGYEIIDGEHRWKACKELGYDKISVKNLGKVDDVKAKTLTILLNEIKGTPEQVQLSRLLNEIKDSTSLEELQIVMPYDKGQLDVMLKVTEFDWETLKQNGSNNTDIITGVLSIMLQGQDGVFVKEVFEKIKTKLGFKTDEECVIFLTKNYKETENG